MKKRSVRLGMTVLLLGSAGAVLGLTASSGHGRGVERDRALGVVREGSSAERARETRTAVQTSAATLGPHVGHRNVPGRVGGGRRSARGAGARRDDRQRTRLRASHRGEGIHGRQGPGDPEEEGRGPAVGAAGQLRRDLPSVRASVRRGVELQLPAAGHERRGRGDAVRPDGQLRLRRVLEDGRRAPPCDADQGPLVERRRRVREPQRRRPGRPLRPIRGPLAPLAVRRAARSRRVVRRVRRDLEDE